MTKEILSEKQVDAIVNSTCRINIWEGSVRSGKTYSSILRFAQVLKNKTKTGNAMVIGVSRDAIQRNFLYEFCDFLSIPIPTPKSTQLNVFGKTIFLVGASDERAQRRIQGSTLLYAYVDEVTLIPKGFFKMLLSRLSKDGAQLFCTTNPDHEYHWFKKEFIDNNNIDKRIWSFTLDDNPALSQEYIKSLKSEYTGLWYKRYILGLWCVAEGLVYDFFDPDIHVIDYKPAAQKYVVSIDYGTTNPTTFILIGYNPAVFPNVWVEKEYYYDSKEHNRQKTDTEYTEDLINFINHKNVSAAVVDPSAASFKLELMRSGVNVVNANNDVLDGIRVVSNLMNNGTLKIHESCTNLIREKGSYCWDEKACNRGKDEVKKTNDHCCDAERYGIKYLEPILNNRPLDDNEISISELNRRHLFV